MARMAQYVLINPVGTRHAGEVLDSVQDGQEVINQLAAFGGVLVPLPNALLQPYIDRCQSLILVGNYDEATAMMQAAYASSTAISGGGTPGSIPIWSSASGLADSAIAQVSGAIRTLTLTNAGAGATNGTYSQQALTGGSGSGATADIVVTGGVVTTLALRNPGTGYTVGNTLSCATIGGAGFVFTVSAVSASDNASGDVTALRLGVGTPSALTTLYAAGAISATKFERRAATQISSPSMWSALAILDTESEPGGVFSETSNDTNVVALAILSRVNLSAVSAGKFVHGIYGTVVMTSPTSTSFTALAAAQLDSRFEAPAMTGRASLSTRGVLASANIGNVGAGNTFQFLRCVDAQGFIAPTTSQTITDHATYHAIVTYNTTAAQTIASFHAFRSAAHGFLNAAHVVTNFYGLRIEPVSLSGGATITNRWGVSHEDALGKSRFYGNLGVGNLLDVGAGKVIGSLTLTNGGTGYTNNSYSQVALTTVTGTGTGATADIVVAGGIVTTVVLRAPGQGYAVGDTLSCASIGAGSNFLVTVATTASILRSDGTVVGTRVGAGTTNPIAGVDSRSAMAVLGTSQFIATNPSFPSSPLNVQAAAYVGTTADPSGRCTPPLGTTIALGYFGNPIFDMSSQTAFCQATGAFFKSSLEIAGNGSSTRVQGVSADARVFGSTISGKTLSIFAYSAQANVGTDLSNANTFSLITSYSSSQNVQSTTAQTITSIVSFNDNSTFFSGGAHVVTNHYAFRSVAPTLGSATITNRWGISLEDAAANNVFAGRSAMGQAAGTAATALVDVGASTTAAASLRIRSGTAPTTPNDGDIWFDGTALRIRIAGVTRTVTVT